MTARGLVLLAAGGSALLMLGALAFQYVGGLPPCAMCYWQRYPHVAAVMLGLVFLTLPSRIVAGLGGLAASATAGIGVFHTGVERGWWEGPSTCTSQAIGGMSTDQLLDQIMAAPLVRCDEVAWQMLGLSMASWNAVLSLALVLLWAEAVRRVHIR